MTGTDALIALAATSAIGAVDAGVTARRTAEFNARVAEEDARATRAAAAFEEERNRENVRRLISAQRAAIGASGTLPEGDPILVVADTAADAELDALAIRFSGSVQEARARSQAALARAEGRARQTASFFDAGSAILTGASGVEFKDGKVVKAS